MVNDEGIGKVIGRTSHTHERRSSADFSKQPPPFHPCCLNAMHVRFQQHFWLNEGRDGREGRFPIQFSSKQACLGCKGKARVAARVAARAGKVTRGARGARAKAVRAPRAATRTGGGGVNDMSKGEGWQTTGWQWLQGRRRAEERNMKGKGGKGGKGGKENVKNGGGPHSEGREDLEGRQRRQHRDGREGREGREVHEGRDGRADDPDIVSLLSGTTEFSDYSIAATDDTPPPPPPAELVQLVRAHGHQQGLRLYRVFGALNIRD